MFNPVEVLVLRKDRATLSKRLTKNPKYSTNVMEILAYRFDCVEFLLETHLALFSAKHFWGGFGEWVGGKSTIAVEGASDVSFLSFRVFRDWYSQPRLPFLNGI